MEIAKLSTRVLKTKLPDLNLGDCFICGGAIRDSIAGIKYKDKNMKKLLSEIYEEMGIQFTFPICIKNNQDKVTYYEKSNGFWARSEYDAKGKVTYYEDSKGDWCRYEYNEASKITYYEDSDGYWARYEYDEKSGKETYYENSKGDKRGKPRKSCAGKVITVDGQKYKLTAV